VFFKSGIERAKPMAPYALQILGLLFITPVLLVLTARTEPRQELPRNELLKKYSYLRFLSLATLLASILSWFCCLILTARFHPAIGLLVTVIAFFAFGVIFGMSLIRLFVYSERIRYLLNPRMISFKEGRDFITRDKPFALYLRAFEKESGDAVFRAGIEPDGLKIPHDEEDNDAARAVMPFVRQSLKVIGCVNPVAGPHFEYPDMFVDCLGSDWPSFVRDAADAARLVVFDSGTSKLGEGMKDEVQLLVDKHLTKTIVLVSVGSHLIEEYPQLSGARWVIKGGRTSAAIPEDLKTFLGGSC
jgi:hypothetical protein